MGRIVPENRRRETFNHRLFYASLRDEQTEGTEILPRQHFFLFARSASKKRGRVGFLFSYEFLHDGVGSKRGCIPRPSCSFFPCFSQVRPLNRTYINRRDKFSVNPRAVETRADFCRLKIWRKDFDAWRIFVEFRVTQLTKKRQIKYNQLFKK